MVGGRDEGERHRVDVEEDQRRGRGAKPRSPKASPVSNSIAASSRPAIASGRCAGALDSASLDA
jgi:hypothetical protein